VHGSCMAAECARAGSSVDCGLRARRVACVHGQVLPGATLHSAQQKIELVSLRSLLIGLHTFQTEGGAWTCSCGTCCDGAVQAGVPLCGWFSSTPQDFATAALSSEVGPFTDCPGFLLPCCMHTSFTALLPAAVQGGTHTGGWRCTQTGCCSRAWTA
jgi:hypothetical protein